jgi:diaminohydroxyphosphoribosylaminopyrimidine deaminase/5-amino-6-(5-phosphoribosylamino)uracil reductase
LKSDTTFMRRALELARQAEGFVSPRPAVGCVLVAGAEIVGQGFTRPSPGVHAEVDAIADAGSGARDATAYVTLEPCAHTSVTGPCATALIEAGISRVVSAMRDPDVRVRRRGFAMLRKATTWN